MITELKSYNEFITTRNNNAAYDKALAAMQSAETEKEYEKAASMFDIVSEWKDAAAKSAECSELAEVARKDSIYDEAMTAMQDAETEADYKEAASMFDEIPEWKDAAAKSAECLELAENARKAKTYDDAAAKMEKDTVESYQAAQKLLPVSQHSWRCLTF